jgi:protein-S-isoprenylcysteine O-methyltransferase Ste14
MHEKIIASVLRAGSTAALVLAFGFMAYGGYRRFMDTGSIAMLGLFTVNCLFVAMFIARRDAISVSLSPALWLIAFLGTFLPLLMRPTAAMPSAGVGNAIQLVGIVCIIASILSLRRSFGIVPANRGVRTEGLYNVIRHPLYASELLTFGGFAVANPSLWNISLWLADCALQLTRACAEERFLSTDPAYQQYRARVRYRLIPRVI